MNNNRRAHRKKKQKISDKYMLLVDHYMTNGFNRKAAMAACGYPESSQKGYVYRLFDHPDIVAEIERRRARLHKRYELNEDFVVQRLMRLADHNFGDIMQKLRENDWDLMALTADERFALKSMTVEEYVEGKGPGAPLVKKVKVEAKDVIAPLQTLARKLWAEKVEVVGEMSLVEKIQRGREQANVEVESD